MKLSKKSIPNTNNFHQVSHIQILQLKNPNQTPDTHFPQ